MVAEHPIRSVLGSLLVSGLIAAPAVASPVVDQEDGLVGSKAAKLILSNLAGAKMDCPPDGPKGTKLRVLVFWATWSSHSGRELRRLQKLAPTWSKSGIDVLAINVESSSSGEEERARVSKWLSANELTLPMALDAKLKAFKAYGVVAVPTTFVIGEEGRILKRLSGWPAAGSERLIRSITDVAGKEGKSDARPEQKSSQPHRRANRLIRMARQLMKLKQWEMARYSLEESLKHAPDSVEARILLFDLYKETGDKKAAATTLETSLKLFPSDPRVLLQEAKEAFASGDLQTAKDLIARAHKEDPSYLPTFLLQARIALSQKDPTSALVVLDLAMKFNPLHPDAFIEAAKILESRGDKEQAFVLYETAYRLLRVGL